MQGEWVRRLRNAALVCLSLLIAGAVSAHHSESAYDKQKQVILSGTVKEFRWANPHCWLYVLVPDEKGQPVEWALEGGSISVLARNGWRAKSLNVGDHVRVYVNPNRDGSPGGGFLTVTLDDGTVYTIGVI
ncbi:MAG: DUF6152 family protein [Steroidobacteraceae bacterium]